MSLFQGIEELHPFFWALGFKLPSQLVLFAQGDQNFYQNQRQKTHAALISQENGLLRNC